MITAAFITVVVRNSDLARLERPVPGLPAHNESDEDITAWHCRSPYEARRVIDCLVAAGLRWEKEPRVFDQIAVHQGGMGSDCEWLTVEDKKISFKSA